MSLLLIGSILVALFVATVFVALVFRKVVPTNMVHIVQSRKNTVAYGKGKEEGNVYYAWPSWFPRIGITVAQFPESIFDVTLTGYEAYDQGRLPFMTDIKAFFRISDCLTAAQRVASFTELTEQLQAVVQSAVRRILATNHLEQIMQDRARLGQQFTEEVDGQLKEWGVQTVKSIEFMDIRDSQQSKVIHNMMAKEQSRIEMESRTTVASNIKSAQTAEIDAQRAVDVQKQDAAQQVGLRTAEQQKQVGIANEKAKQDIQAEAKVTAERQMEVVRVNDVKKADINKQVVEVNANAAKAVAVTQASAAKEVAIVTADGQREATTLKAEGDLQAALKSAKGIEAEGLAKGVAETAILQAPVTAQITLAKEIGENNGYQTYLIQVRQVEASEKIGVANADALKAAEIKVIANGGNIQEGVSGIGDILSSKGGTAIGALVSALKQNPDVASLLPGASTKPAAPVPTVLARPSPRANGAA